MAQGDVIQKDLGLVTAYGYALAGGYTGSEEQFERDFATLMSGQYTALANKPSINGVTLVGNKTTEELGIATGVTNYSQLSNLPSINGVTLTGDKTSSDLGLEPSADETVVAEDATSKFKASGGTLVPIIEKITRYSLGGIMQVNIQFNMPAGTYNSSYVGFISLSDVADNRNGYLPYYLESDGIDHVGFSLQVSLYRLHIIANTGKSITLSEETPMAYTTGLFINLTQVL